jgi:hypothetical protein
MMIPCLEWMGARSSYGYGQVWDSKSKCIEYAHRRAWKFESGREIPTDGVIAHICDNPPCCEPTHLFLTTRAGNQADMAKKKRSYNQNTHKVMCKNNHPFDDKNTYKRKNSRICRRCHADRERARRSRAGS